MQVGEVWTEIVSELQSEGVRPVTPDMEAIEAITRGIEERAQIVCGTQIELLEAQQNQDVLDEQEFYAEVGIRTENSIAIFAWRIKKLKNNSLISMDL